MMASPYVKSYTDSRAVTRNQSTAFGTVGRTSVTHDSDMALESHMLPVLSTGNDAYMRGKAYTPFEELEIQETFGERPDISMYCKECDRHIDLRNLAGHKYYHRALQIMMYNETKPDSVAMLSKRRRGIVRRMKKHSKPYKPIDPDEVQKLNDAYEFLKADLEDTYDSTRRITDVPNTDVPSIALNCTPACAIAVGICSSENERWKSSMEDTRVFQDCFGNDPRKCFFGIYDGHQGHFAAEIAAQELHHAVLLCMAKFDPRTKCTCTFNMDQEYNVSDHSSHSRATSSYSERGILLEASQHAIHQIINNCEELLESLDSEPGTSTPKSKKSKTNKDPFAEKMGHAFGKAHKYTDSLLAWGREENSKVRWSGCSTLACVLQETPVTDEETNAESDEIDKPKPKGPPPLKQLGVLHLANAGNVHAVLVRGNVPYRLTRDHTPNNPKEYNRVIRSGGNINESEKQSRVNGVLSTTRGLGNHGDPVLKKVVLTDPYTTSVPIDQFAQFIILASNGVWDVFSEQEAANLCLQYHESVWVLPQNRIPISSNILSESVLHLSDPQNDNQSEPALQNHPDDESSLADAATERRKKKKPRASTARSCVSFVDEEQIQERIRYDRAGNHIKTSILKLDKLEIDNKLDPDVDSDADDRDNNGIEDNVKKVHEYKSGGFEVHTQTNEPNDKKKIKNLGSDVNVDMRTEVGSRADDDYSSDEYDEEDLGNEADVDTATEMTSVARLTAMSNNTPTEDQLQRDFARGMAERLVQSALLAGARDNITVMIVLLPGCGL